MSGIQIIAYLLLVSLFSTINCNVQENSNEDMDYANSYAARRNLVAEYLHQYIDKRAAAKSICGASTQCADSCNPSTRYDASTTCGLTCYDNKWVEQAGSTGICQLSSNVCAGAASTFCPGGNYTRVHNGFAGNPSYFDCNNGYGCGNNGGCCVRIAGATTNNWQYYCLKSDEKRIKAWELPPQPVVKNWKPVPSQKSEV
ncbi:unnamed protein product [Adineta steineri]|uniref:Uncharacterized protein n=1 Tax=Adineta steineri TaxID=433720 RepID=A0A815U608_9BILA|nr:unnamed protein product [Adineta steineri]CAF1647676.1 unnamed protein product [Adineta steineri]